MRKLLILALLFIAQIAYAQEAGLTVPVSRSSEAKFKIRSFSATVTGTNTISVDVSVQDSGNSEIRVAAFTVPDATHPGATFAGMATAMVTVRATETGGDARKLAFRILGYLADNGYFPANSLTP